MTDLRTAAQQALALICSARLCETNSMSSRREMLRLLIEATDILRAALAQQAEPYGVEEMTTLREVLHVVPLNDLREHVSSKDCWCKPTEDDQVDDVWVHHSMDKREEYEERRKPT